MGGISFDLGALFERTFGYKTEAFGPQFDPVTGFGGIGSLARIEFGSYGSDYYTNDALGREYYMPVKITYPDNSVASGLIDNTDGPDALTTDSTGRLKTWNLPYPIISINSRKTIIETPLTERRGTVKELINIQDYEISIKGFIVAATNEFPENEVITLRSVYEQNVALSIQCPLTDIFLLRPDRSGSDKVVITELKFPPVAGIKNVRPYELRMISDEPFNLITTS
jgi:uncharacterized protein DUF6046